MADNSIPSEAPPPYSQVIGSASASTSQPTSRLTVPARNDIPAEHRRSMEDEARPLPKGWLRTFDPENEHQFFVDTNQDPPRSIWTHPYDDEEYLRSLPSAERERIEAESEGRHRASVPDLMAEHTDEEGGHSPRTSSSTHAELPPRPTDDKKTGKDRSLGRKLKDKLTSSTHEEREQARARRAEQERQLYARHMKYRAAMLKAVQTGQPQLLGQDREGKDVYIEPPAYRGGSGLYGGRGYGYNPYGSGMYAPPGRYMRPVAPYGRPYGAGYGGGYGMPLALGGGLMGGMALGGLM
ncbi:uncharacterized protein BDZ99DRAFT_490892 [Mytilinidion resinicola]|uniref:WW domain-containing protein n=1 Tax=Mytilinidion resinicola TaxID=574789 RepID=A0A6A6Y9L3_9PEZI|nr:uncharacterized protein BDZ99DRAFT_490892 [Mytilinidion resinicola]KAF2805380.1 hypothetical protein BDZ99DRAFT_490892 [Mytilinidion resinicola]